MAIKLDYVARETGTNLARNFTITLASVLTVVGVARARRRVAHGPAGRRATPPSAGRAASSSSSSCNPSATQEQIDGVGARPRGQPADRARSTSSTRTRPTTSSRSSSRDSPEMIENGHARDPARRRSGSSPIDKNAETVSALGEQFKTKPGVLRGRLGHRDHPAGPAASASSSPRASSWSPSFLLGAAVPAHPQHHPHGHVRPPARDRGDEARRRHQLVHPRPVHARGPRPGRHRRGRSPSARSPCSGPCFEGWLPAGRPDPAARRASCRPARDMFPIYLLVGLVGCLVGAIGRRRRRHPLPRRLIARPEGGDLIRRVGGAQAVRAAGRGPGGPPCRRARGGRRRVAPGRSSRRPAVGAQADPTNPTTDRPPTEPPPSRPNDDHRRRRPPRRRRSVPTRRCRARTRP